MMKNIVLMGIKHCGKSTQARLLSQKLNCPMFDTDTEIENIYSKTAREIYAQEGEEAFKKAEKEACISVINKASQSQNGAVIATGGGICCNSEALNVLRKDSIFVFLMAQENLASDRIVRECNIDENGTLSNLPAYIAKKNPRTTDDVRDIFHDFYEERTRIYSGIADAAVRMDNAPKYVNMERIFNSIKGSLSTQPDL